MPSNNSNLITRCGIYCGACYIHRAYVDDREFLAAIAERTGAPKNEIRCGGCLGPSEQLWRNCKKCLIYACLKEKQLNFCYECPQFEDSCSKYDKLEKFCAERGENPREALRRIKAGDAPKWLEEQDQKWRCPSCRGPISWYEKTCHHCNSSLIPKTYGGTGGS